MFNNVGYIYVPPANIDIEQNAYSAWITELITIVFLNSLLVANFYTNGLNMQH